MSNATVNISGIGNVSVKTDATVIEVAGAIAADGTPVNRLQKKVSRDARKAQQAARNDERGYMKHIRDNVFVFIAA